MPRYFEFEIALQEIQPVIWRRFAVPTNLNFAQLHRVIQACLGWEDRHLWAFRFPTYNGRCIASSPHDEGPYGPPDGRHVAVNGYFTGILAVQWCEYNYDFGDDWVLDVKLVRAYSDKERFKRRLFAGESSAPPEDCGGVPGYYRMAHFVETGEVQEDEDPQEVAAWLQGWRPDGFELKAAQAAFDR